MEGHYSWKSLLTIVCDVYDDRINKKVMTIRRIETTLIDYAGLAYLW